VSGITALPPVASGESSGSSRLEAHGCSLGAGPLQQAHGETKVAIGPGPDGHGPPGVIKALASVPLESVSVALAAIAGEAGRNAVFGGAQAATALGEHVVDGFRWFPAINAGFMSK